MQLEFGDGMDFLGAAELRTQLSQQLTANKDAARKRYERLLTRMNTPHRILTRDKAAFVLGTLGAMCAHLPCHCVSRPCTLSRQPADALAP